MCFVRIWEQTAIISLYGINWLNVYYAVRTEYTILFSLNLRRADHSSRWVLLSEVCPMSVIAKPLRGPWPGIGSKRHKGEKKYGSQNKKLLFPCTAFTYTVFIIETKCVYCTVRAQSLMQVFKWWPLIAEARIWSLSSSCEICGGQSSPEAVFRPRTSVFPCQNHSPTFLTRRHLKYNLTKPANF